MFDMNSVEVLVAGAGPVGMTVALSLAARGIRVAIIDSATGTAAHSYACALHSRNLELLEQFGLLPGILQWAYCVEKLAFYEGYERRASIDVSSLDTKYPFIAVLPQNALEFLLERMLREWGKICVNWRHQLSGLQNQPNGVASDIITQTPLARQPVWYRDYRVAAQVKTRFVVGADGSNSSVRQGLGIENDFVGEAQVFSIVEFETDQTLDKEIKVVLDDTTSNVLWPISPHRGRWTFESSQQQLEHVFPEKSRVPEEDKDQSEQETHDRLQAFVRTRAPWFDCRITKIDWSQRVRFPRRLSKSFGKDFCWLVGDSAHQTSPIGMQSLNLGLDEADELARALKNVLNGSKTWSECSSVLASKWQQQWLELLAKVDHRGTPAKANSWVKKYAPRIRHCLPATGEHLDNMLNQLGWVR